MMSLFMMWLSILMGAVRAEADGVLQDELVVGLCSHFIPIVLQTEAAELAGRIIDHRRIAARREIARIERRSGKARAQRRRVYLVIAHADAPEGYELVH